MIIVLLANLFVTSLSYKALSYDEMLVKFTALNQTCDFLHLSSAQNEFGLDYPANCTECPTLIATVTKAPLDAPQVYFSGCLHGNERLGPVVVTELADYLCTEYGKNEWITRLVDTRIILMTPATNAQGYYYNHREEILKDGTSVDPNRDFGYRTNGNCLRTTTAQTVKELLDSHLVQLSITFHGGDSAIGYPWGSHNHYQDGISTEAPDFTASDQIARAITKYSNADIKIGTMSDTVYPVDGGMEDWAYAAGWENESNPSKPINSCNGFSDIQNKQGFKQLMFLVETDDVKSPRNNMYGTKNQVLDPAPEGLIPQYIRMSLGLIDLVEPYIKIDILPNAFGYEVTWEVWGCIQVDWTSLYYTPFTTETNQTVHSNLNQALHLFSQTMPQSGDCGGKTVFYESIEGKNNLLFFVAASVDRKWLDQAHPDPQVPPQSHVVRARTDPNYFVSVNNYSIQGKNKFYSRVNYAKTVSYYSKLYSYEGYSGELRINSTQAALEVELSFSYPGNVTLVLSEYGDLRNLYEAFFEKSQNFLYEVCNSTATSSPSNFASSYKCQNSELAGKAVGVKSEDKLLSFGVVSPIVPLPLPPQGGVCTLYSDKGYSGFLVFSPQDNNVKLKGMVTDATQNSNISIQLGKNAEFLLETRPGQEGVVLQETVLKVGKDLLGAVITLKQGDTYKRCTVGTRDPDYAHLETRASSQNQGIWIYIAVGVGVLAVVGFLVLLAGRKKEHEEFRHMTFREEEEHKSESPNL